MIMTILPEQSYIMTMASVNLLNKGQPSYETDEEWAATVIRNKNFIEKMLAKDIWTTEDLTPFKNAIG
jgi:hypothetical protein